MDTSFVKLWSGPARRRWVAFAVSGVTALAVGLRAIGPLDAQAPATVTVQPGDTLSDLAVRFYGTVAAIDRIFAANAIADPDLVLAGTTLVLPGIEAPVAANASASGASGVRTVTVGFGDSLELIAQRLYGSASYAAALAAFNNLADPNRVIAGSTLRAPANLPAGGAAAGSTTSGTGALKQVTVEVGDSLATIATRLYGSPGYAQALAAVNNLSDPNRIIAGTKLKAPVNPPSIASGVPVTGSGRGVLGGRRICIDPGHGGVPEPGAVFEFGDGRLLREADVTLDIARTLRGWLLADGATVTMTRSADVYLDLDERAALCNASGADIAISIHLNSVNSAFYNGALALFNKSVDRKLADGMATTLQSGLARTAPGGPFTAFGSQPFEGRILSHTLMPAVIVEPVFLSYPAEAQALLAPSSVNGSRRNQIVTETYRGVRLYFNQ